jgi:cytoskeletal protein CcmA (bactofilin family)
MSVFSTQSDRAPINTERRPTPQFGDTSVPTPETNARKVSVLGKTLVFKGELSAEEDLVLQGRVEGSIRHTQSVTVGADGVVIGDIHARNIVIEGTVEGDLHGSAAVNVSATANVRGNISAPRVGIVEGAQFNGSVDMSSAPAATRRDPSSERTLSDRTVDQMLARP